MKNLWFSIFVLFCNFNITHSQESTSKVPDSLQNKTYDYLFEAMRNAAALEKTEKAKYYMQIVLAKAHMEKNGEYAVKGYFLLYYLNDDARLAMQYIDSAMVSSKNLGYPDYDGILLTSKGGLHYSLREYKLALDSYLGAKRIAEEQNDAETLMDSEYSIGLIQSRIGANEEAIQSSRNYYDLVAKANQNSFRPILHLQALNGLSDVYLYDKQLDSASLYTNLLINEAKKFNSREFLIKGKGNEAILSFHQKKYRQSIDSILKYLPEIVKKNDSLTMSFANFYLGKSYAKLEQWETAIEHFQKADSIIRNKQIHMLELRENYDILHSYFKDKGDLPKQLAYLEKLIDFDSILYENNTYLKNSLFTNYEKPKLFEEKERLIEQLEARDGKKSLALYAASILISILLIVVLYSYRKRVLDKKRFKALINENVSTTHMGSRPENSKNEGNDQKEILRIPEAIVEDILDKLDRFEENQKFLNPKITLNSLAKSLGTNSSYLSKIVNHHKEKNFSSFLSDLRIQYAIKALQEQPKLREYTVKAIAFEVGFKNSESFTNAFYKQTKIYPSYFIKQLKKQDGSA